VSSDDLWARAGRRVARLWQWVAEGGPPKGPVVALRRVRRGAVTALVVEFRVPRVQAGRLIDALCGAAAAAMAPEGLDVAAVGLVPGEAPRLFVCAPRRDLIASAVETRLTANPAHRIPTLWLLLQRGTYLAEVVEPHAPLDFDDALVGRWIVSGSVAAAALATVEPAPRELITTWVLYGPMPFLRRCVKAARSFLSTLPDWRIVRNANPGTASRREKARLHR